MIPRLKIITKPTPARVLIEEDVWALKRLSRMLYAAKDHQDQFDDITLAAFLSLAKTLEERVNECTIDYGGEKYVIMARGRRRLRLGFKREPDLYIGSEYGTNFVEACQWYFKFQSRENRFNKKKLTYNGRTLFGLPAKDVTDYATGIKPTGNGYSVWFTLCNQTYTLTPEETEGNAELQRKMLNRSFDNLLILKKTKP